MENLCLLTGLPKSESPIKKMCINCCYSQYNGETYVCNNTNVMEKGFEKIKEAAKNFGFDIETLKIKPMELKNPIKKCNYYSINNEKIQEYINSILYNDEQKSVD